MKELLKALSDLELEIKKMLEELNALKLYLIKILKALGVELEEEEI